MTSLKEHIIRKGSARRAVHENVGEVRVTRSPDLTWATVSLPGDIDLRDRAARMNEFWRQLVDYQYRDVLVVALCAGGER